MLMYTHRQPLQAFKTSHRHSPFRPHARGTRFHVRAEAAGNSKAQLVVVGSLNADTVLEVDRIPEGGETMNAKTLSTFPGGKVRQIFPQVILSILCGISSYRKSLLTVKVAMHSG